MTQFDVVGDVLGELEGEVDGDVLGAVQDALHRHLPAHRGGGRHMRLPAKPSWRQNTLAPGVEAPQEGLVPLPMTAQTNGGTFTSAIPAITWTGRLQKPFRSERFLISVVRVGTSAVGRLLGQFFVGVDLQQAQIAGLDLELLGVPTAFGTRLTLLQAPPGVELTIPVVLSTALASTDTIFASMMFLGRIVH